jgi:uncharacterized OsmC-like protein/alpha/beta superfamily hydrolase
MASPRYERVSFAGHSGEMLDARLDLPAGAPRAVALFAHCFTCSKDSPAATFVARALTETGIAVLRFDFTGLGGSDGDFANTDFSSNVADLIAAADYLRGRGLAPQILIGHSLGGAAAIIAAHDIAEVRAVATVGAPAEAAHVQRYIKSPPGGETSGDGNKKVEIAGRSFEISDSLLDDLAGQKITEAASHLRRALLIFHSPRDEVVDVDNAARLFMAAKHPKSFVSLDDADHLLTRRADAAYVGRVLSAWASRYLPKAEEDAEPAADEGTVLVRETRTGRYMQDVFSGAHRLTADEPEKAGGNDAGPSPYDYLSIALGACTSMTLRMYVERKDWPLARVSVAVRHEKIHAEDCAECHAEPGTRIDRFTREITIEGDVDAEQRRRLMEIADKCPVHKTLHSPVDVVTKLVE